MTRTILLGATLAALAVASLFSVASAHLDENLRADYMEIVDSDTTGDSSTITLGDDLKQIPANNALDLITFWAIGVTDEIGPGAVNVAALTIHHGVNDHQYVGSLDDDPNTPNQEVRSNPVQSFHPHYASFDGNFCLVALESPDIDFRVKDNMITLDTSDVDATDFVVTGTIGPRGECTGTGLGITGVDDHN